MMVGARATIYGGGCGVGSYVSTIRTYDTIGMGLSWMSAPLCTVYIRRLFWDLFGVSENLFGQTDFCFRCKNLFSRDVLGFFGKRRKQRICLSPPAGPKICFINLFSVHKSER